MDKSPDSQLGAVPHPFFPRDLFIPHYVPNDKTAYELLGVFGAVLSVSLLILWIVMSYKSHLNGKFLVKMKVSWFLVCGLIHSILEGYFALNHKTLAGGSSFLDQMCKNSTLHVVT